MYQNFIIPYLYKAQHALGETPPIISSLKLHWQLLVFHTWKVVGRVVSGRCQMIKSTNYTSNIGLYVKYPLFLSDFNET
jgi:hypothetical protein